MDRSNGVDVERLVLFIERRPAVESEPLVQYRRIEPAKVDTEFERAFIQVRQVWMDSYNALF